jgi:hypothetical protein
MSKCIIFLAFPGSGVSINHDAGRLLDFMGSEYDILVMRFKLAESPRAIGEANWVGVELHPLA